MVEVNPLIEFHFFLPEGVSDSELDALWQGTVNAQIAMDKFLAGEMSELELHDYLEFYDIDTGETLDVMEENSKYMGLILP